MEEDDLEKDAPGHRCGYAAVVGRPNAGKSTLLNALVQQKLSTVTSRAQTTRHRILSILSEPDFQMIILDTPGVLREERNELDKKMMQNVRTARRDADVLLAIIDADNRPEEALHLLNLRADQPGLAPMCVVLNKVDLLRDSARVQQLQEWYTVNSPAAAVIPVSALSGQNVDAVRQWAVSHLPLGPSLYPKDNVTELPERFFVAEIIQEKIFQQYHDEIPYCSSVQVVDFKEREGHKDLVQVHVTVETPSQRAIIIGKGGTALKRLGTHSRQDVEAFLGRPVYLDISVKVQDKWRKDPQQVLRFGY